MNWRIYICIALILFGVGVWVNEHYFLNQSIEFIDIPATKLPPIVIP